MSLAWSFQLIEKEININERNYKNWKTSISVVWLLAQKVNIAIQHLFLVGLLISMECYLKISFLYLSFLLFLFLSLLE